MAFPARLRPTDARGSAPCGASAFYADEHVVVLSALIREKFLKVRRLWRGDGGWATMQR